MAEEMRGKGAMMVAYFGNDIFIDCFRHLHSGKHHRILKLFSVAYGEGEYDLAQSTRRLARLSGIPVQTTPALPRDLQALERQGCEAIISAGYSHKIPPWCGGAIRYAVNIHPTLLPRGAGPMPLPWVILKGLERTGVTIHKLTDTWDGGDILLQESFPLSGRENIEELLAKSQSLALELLDRFLGAPDAYWHRATPQSPGDREYWPRLTPQDYSIDWNWELGRIERYLRIYRYASQDGVVEFVTDVTSSRKEHPHVPGTLLRVDGERREVAVKDGIVSFRVRTRRPV
jgi:methionyl-tRNA formyltransferase